MTFEASHLEWRYIWHQRVLQARLDFVLLSNGSSIATRGTLSPQIRVSPPTSRYRRGGLRRHVFDNPLILTHGMAEVADARSRFPRHPDRPHRGRDSLNPGKFRAGRTHPAFSDVASGKRETRPKSDRASLPKAVANVIHQRYTVRQNQGLFRPDAATPIGVRSWVATEGLVPCPVNAAPS